MYHTDMPEDARTGERAQRIVDTALRIATASIEGSLTELAELAEGDREALVRACDALRGRRVNGQPKEKATQHLAFSLVTAVFQTLNGDAGDRGERRAAVRGSASP
jgi:hypothetical protein